MDKLIKSISKSGSFRAYVLDSTETVRTAQEKHQTLSSSTVALGRTLIANQILAANQKGDSKVTIKVIGNSSLGHIISVADTKGHVKGYIQNTGVDVKKTATGEVIVGPFMGAGQFVVITDYGTGNPCKMSNGVLEVTGFSSQILEVASKMLKFQDPMFLVKEIEKILIELSKNNFLNIRQIITLYCELYFSYLSYYFNDKNIKAERNKVNKIKDIFVNQIRKLLDDYIKCLKRVV